MHSDALSTRLSKPDGENISRGFMVALSGHAAAIALLVGSTWLAHHLDPHWGETDPAIGSIQASMVNSLPLPSRQLYKEHEVLTSEHPNVAPAPPPPTNAPPAKSAPALPKAEPAPKPHEILLPSKVLPTAMLKPATREQPVVPRRVTPPVPPTPKATTGDTGGVQIPQSVTNLKNGTATITVEERAFGDRYAYYIRLISQKVDAAKQEQGLDPTDAKGKRAAVRFTISRDGTPTDAQLVTHSGSSGLDNNALRTIQRIDTFGPLPAGDHLTVTFGFSDDR